MTNKFLSPQENELCECFLKQGYVIFDLDKKDMLEQLRFKIYSYACEKVSNNKQLSISDYLNQIANSVKVEELNSFRLSILQKMSSDDGIKLLIYQLAKQYIHTLVGNELAMQRACNLSIQLPNDDSSLLALHSDVWSGNSPYEIVLWLPLVDCYKTKSMYLLPRNNSRSTSIREDLSKTNTAEQYFKLLESELVWPALNYGQAMIFSHTIPHGNRINQEIDTRWTLNIRFKSLLTPYGHKGLGESFLPITSKPVTTIGYEYPSNEWNK